MPVSSIQILLLWICQTIFTMIRKLGKRLKTAYTDKLVFRFILTQNLNFKTAENFIMLNLIQIF